MADRPQSLLKWTDGNADQVQAPPASLMATGYTAGEAPSAETFNYILWQITNWIAYLAAANGSTVLQTTLDASTRLTGGGTWSYNSATRVLSWGAPVYLAVPTLPLSANRLPAGSLTIPAGSVVVVQANVPLTVTGAIASGSATVSNVSTAISMPVGASVTGDGIPAGTTVTAVNANTLTLSASATKNNETAALTLLTQGDLSAAVYDIASVQPSANTVVIAYGSNDYVAIGVNSVQMSLRNGEAKTLMGLTGYTGMVCANAGTALSARQALYISNGTADGRTAGQVYLADASSQNGATRAQFVGFASHDVNAGDCAALVSMGTMTGFSGLAPGTVYYLDPSTPGAIIGSRTTTAGQYAVPVGFAIDNSSLRINPEATRNLTPVTADSNLTGNLTVGGTASIAGATSLSTVNASGIVTASKFVSGAGFAQTICFGQMAFTNTTSSLSSGFNGVTRYFPCDAAGSVLTAKFSAPTYVRGNWTFTVSKISAGSSTFSFITTAAAPFSQSGYGTPTLIFSFPKGQWTFAAGDVLYVGASVSQSQSATAQISADITIEQGQ